MKNPLTQLFRGVFCALLVAGATVVAQAEDVKPPKEKKEKKIPEAVLQKFDANGDGTLDATEKAAWQADLAKKKEMQLAKKLKKYDANNNGQLDPEELAAEKADMEARAEKKKLQNQDK